MQTEGAFTVDATGAARYTIPITVPPGVAGLQPSLSLDYNSQAGNGVVGMGWSIGGLSAITRCPRTMAQDGARGGVAHNANDRFCLDGKRLVAVSGAYGAAGSEYRTELDTFSQVKAQGSVGDGPSSFVVKTKGGLTMEYGNTADSKLLTQSGSVARSWALNKVTDAKGNTMAVVYYVQADRSVQVPVNVSYGGNGGTANTLVVEFVYSSTRTDPFSGYAAGSAVRMDGLLANVRTWAGTTLVRDYRLAYTTGGTARTRLASVTECDGSSPAKCLNPTTFAPVAQQGGSTFVPVQPNAVAAKAGDFRNFVPKPADIDGDGIADLIVAATDGAGARAYAWRGVGDGSYVALNGGNLVLNQPGNFGLSAYQLDVVDLDADGFADLIMTYGAQDGARVHAWRGKGDGTFAAFPGTWPAVLKTGTDLFLSQRRFTDFDGDGLPDLIYGHTRVSDGKATWVYGFRGLGNGRFTAYNNGNDLVGLPSSSYHFHTWFAADVNADGLGDLVLSGGNWNSARAFVWLGRGDGTFAPTNGGAAVIERPGDHSAFSSRVADINSDGIQDILFVSATEGAATVYAWLGRGDGSFVAANGGAAVISRPGNFKNYSIDIADVSGDGKSDIVYMLANASAATAYAWIGNGDASFIAVNGASPVMSQAGSSQFESGKTMLVDLTADGLADLLYTSSTGSGIYIHAWSNPNRNSNDLVGTITSGLGAARTIAYASLTTPGGVYTKDSGASAAAFPRIDLRIPTQVVRTVTVSNGIGTDANTTEYTYGGLKAELGTGRGLLGFRWRNARDTATGIETKTTYYQGFPYTGTVAQAETRLPGTGNGGLLRSVATAMNFVPTAGGAVFTHPLTTSEIAWDIAGQPLPTVSTSHEYLQSPQYGDPTKVSVSMSDGYRRDTVNTYHAPDTANWIVGRVKSSAVTHTKP